MGSPHPIKTIKRKAMKKIILIKMVELKKILSFNKYFKGLLKHV